MAIGSNNSTFNNVTFKNIKIINGIKVGTSITTGSWANRPTSPDDGDYYQVTDKAHYRYSSTVGEWVRPEIYEGTPTLIIRIRGSVLPSAESPAWTHTTANAGAITTDGTKVTLDGSTNNNDQASIVYNYDLIQKCHFMQGMVQSDGNYPVASGRWGRAIGIDQTRSGEAPTLISAAKTHRFVINTNSTTASFSTNARYSKDQNAFPYTNAGTNLQYRNGLADATTSEVFLEFYCTPSGSWAYINNSLTPTMVVADENCQNTIASAAGGAAGATTKRYIVGDYDTGEKGKMTIRESFWGTYTPTANTASALNIVGGGV